MNIINKVFGTHSERELKRIEPIVKKIESYRDAMGKLTDDELELESYDLLGVIAKRRGMLISRGEPDTERAAIMLLDEFRAAKLGKISLESPKEI